MINDPSPYMPPVDQDESGSTIDVSTCPGPDGKPVPLLHFDDQTGPGRLAVSLADGRAVFTTPRTPFDLTVNPVMISAADRKELGHRLLNPDPQ